MPLSRHSFATRPKRSVALAIAVGLLSGATAMSPAFAQTDTGTDADLDPAAEAWWPLRGDGQDRSGRAEALSNVPPGDSEDWIADQYGRAGGALEFDGDDCLTSADAEVRTDASFTVSAWARLDAEGPSLFPSLVGLAGESGNTANLKYNQAADRWQFVLSAAEDDDAEKTTVSSDAAPTPGQWTQLTAVYDAEQRTAGLYLDGVPSGEVTVDHPVARATELTVGCARQTRHGFRAPWAGAISQVQLWRGVATHEQIAGSRPEFVSFWPLGKDIGTADVVGTRDLNVTGEPVWDLDRWADCGQALDIDPVDSVHASTTESVLRTDESFTVVAWARLDNLTDRRTVTSQTAETGTSLALAYDPAAGGWVFEMREADTSEAQTAQIVADGAPSAARWYHLAATYDLAAGEMSLYVDGVLAGTGAGPLNPWNAAGALLIGAAGDNFGGEFDYFHGTVDAIGAYTGVLDADEIEDQAGNGPRFPIDPDDADCGGSEEPPPIDL